MAQYAGITVAALAAVMALSGGMLSAAAAETENVTGAAAATASETTELAGNWVSTGGKQYYIYADENKAVGEVMIEGVPYLFGYSGALKTDWQTVGGKRYYYDPETGKPVFGWVSYFGETYYVDPEFGKVTGFFEIEDGLYAFGEDGALLCGEFEMDGVHYYSDPESGELGSNVYTMKTKVVKTDEGGAVLTGWVDPGDGRRYYIHPETCEPLYGLTVIEGEVYYITPEDGAVRGSVAINGVPYHFDEETCARTSGWFEYENARCYFDPELQSTICESFADIDGKRYYFDENGCMATGFVAIGDALYCFGEDGVMKTGTVIENDGVKRVFDENGAALNGWITDDVGRHYYFNGIMTTGWTEIDGAQSYFDADGKLCTGLTGIGDSRYLLDENGKALTGWQELDGTSYYFREDGSMAVSTSLRIDGERYVFDENGVSAIEEIPEVLDVISYKQTDPQWKNASLGGSTIGKVGCLVTSLAMLHTYTTGDVTTPVQMRDKLKFSGGGGLASWNLVTDLGYTVETYSGGITQENMQHIYALLRDGKPVVLGCKKGSSGMHFVIVTGYTGDGENFKASDFTINDPGYSARFTLADHLAEYSSLYKLIY